MTTVREKPTNRVVFHADDFGMNDAVNRGILLAFREGVLTSTSLLANAPAAKDACREWPRLFSDYAASNLGSREIRRKLGEPELPFDLGIHLNLTQGRPLTGDCYPKELLDSEGHFPGIGPLYFRLKRASVSELQSVTAELHKQVEWMCDQSLHPTHLNGHQYIELIPQIAAMIPGILKRYSIKVVRVARESNLFRTVLLRGRPVAWALGLVKRYHASAFQRLVLRETVSFPVHFFGTSHAGQVDKRTTIRFLSSITKPGLTEIGVHPSVEQIGGANDTGKPWNDPLATVRPNEKEWLCGTELPELLHKRGFKLGRLQSLHADLT